MQVHVHSMVECYHYTKCDVYRVASPFNNLLDKKYTMKALLSF